MHCQQCQEIKRLNCRIRLIGQAGFKKANLAAGLVGAVFTFFLIETLKTPLRELLGLHWGTFASNAIIMLFIVALWPAAMKAVTKKSQTEPAE